MNQNKSVEEVVKELRTWACNYHGEFFKRYSSDSEEKKKLWFTADEVEKIIEHTLQTSQEREREIVEAIIADYMEALGTVVLPEEVWLWIADINGKYLNKTLKENI